MNIKQTIKNLKNSGKSGEVRAHLDAVKYIWKHRKEYKDKDDMNMAYFKEFARLCRERGVYEKKEI